MTTQAVAPAPGQAFGPGQEPAADRDGTRDPLRGHTATVVELRDIEAEVQYAMGLHGPRYLHILVTRPLGWSCPASDSIKVARPREGDRPARAAGSARRSARAEPSRCFPSPREIE